tara:strand:- start:407 stop:763 length:357 start_codon:yes stop_codon:yes gene_type:complete
MLFHLVGPVPGDIGVRNGQLSPCPGTAHCAEDLWESTDPEADLGRLSLLISDLPRSLIVEKTENYRHAEVSSAFFGFVDDLELLALEDAIQVRSISRLGDSDLGVNSQRLAVLRDGLS